jgi:MFS superfamily sulfate permease-like transporter
VLLDLEASSEIDIPTNDMLGELAEDLEAEEVELHLARVRAPVRRLLTASGVAEQVGEARIHRRVEDGLHALETERGGDGLDQRSPAQEASTVREK